MKFATAIAGSVLAVAALTAAAAAPSHPARPAAASAVRQATTPAAAAVQPVPAVRLTGTLEPATASAPAQPAPQQIARKMLGSFGWTWRQFRYLNWLWSAESSWNVSALNPSTGAYGIPQAVPGAKMSTAGPAWRTDATTQIRWGLVYIAAAYGSPRAAWQHEVADGWY